MVTRRRLFTGMAALAAASVGKSALAALPEIVSSTATDTHAPLAPPNGRPYRPVATFLRGRLAYDGKDVLAEPGRGAFVRPPVIARAH